MRFIFLILALAQSVFATEAVLSTVGGWPLCPIYPRACVPQGQETYIVSTHASKSSVRAFLFTIRYIQGGAEKEFSGRFWRNESNEYSSSNPIVLGRIEQVISVAATELEEVK